MLTKLNAKQFDKLLQQQKETFCVMFTAQWCGPCQTIKKRIVGTPAATFRNVLIYLVDVDEEDDLSESYGVDSMPTFIFFQRGTAVAKVTGADFDALVKTCATL